MSCKCAIFCDIARRQILHGFRETYKTENTFTLTFICKNKRRSIMRPTLRQKTFVAEHMPMVSRQNHFVARQKLSAIL